MKNLFENDLKNSQQLLNVRQMAENLIKAIDGCPGKITLGNRPLKKPNSNATDKRINRQHVRHAIQKKFNQKYLL